jgi:SAM-dependent methyltransferase
VWVRYGAAVTVDGWVEGGLEAVPSCPLCGSEERELVHKSIEDRVHSAPGTWTLSRCLACRSGYLDPRPTADTIYLAYGSYQTHDVADKVASEDLGLVGRLRRGAANGYRNRRYGTQDSPANPLGLLVALLPSQRQFIDTESRHLPKPGAGGRLLDLGCGEGQFLEFARRAGWSVMGVDFDEHAVEAARSRGLDIRLGGVEAVDPSERFDGITLSHVIEHVHDPLAVLKACYGLLKPGGWIWLQTPNIDALGHVRYGPDWRGLEPPRHLVLFTLESMRKSLVGAGFTGVEVQDAAPGFDFTFPASERIAGNTGDAPELPQLIKAAEKQAAHDPAVREFITIKAFKPAGG